MLKKYFNNNNSRIINLTGEGSNIHKAGVTVGISGSYLLRTLPVNLMQSDTVRQGRAYAINSLSSLYLLYVNIQ